MFYKIADSVENIESEFIVFRVRMKLFPTKFEF